MAAIAGALVTLGAAVTWVISVEVRFAKANDLQVLGSQIDGLREEISAFREDAKSARIRMNKWEEVMLPVLTEFRVKQILEEKGQAPSVRPAAPSALPGGAKPSSTKIRKDAEKWANSRLPREAQEASPAPQTEK